MNWSWTLFTLFASSLSVLAGPLGLDHHQQALIPPKRCDAPVTPAPVAGAAVALPTRVTFVLEKCMTYITTKSTSPVPTSTETAYKRTWRLPIPAFIVVTPTKTVTPSPVTQTITATALTTETQSQETDTFYSTPKTTVTEQETITAFSTELTTVTEVTTETPTTTIPQPAGFIYPTAPGNDEFEALQATPTSEARADRSPNWPYPYRVQCNLGIDVITQNFITLAARRTQTTTAEPSTSVATSTTTMTTTKLQAAASTTITAPTETFTSTEVTTTTSTETGTVTASVTESAPTTTKYAVCRNPYNFVSRNDEDEQLFPYPAEKNPQMIRASDHTACCDACFNAANCAGSTYVKDFGMCLLYVKDTCPAKQAQRAALLFPPHPPPQEGIYSNGPCGKFDYAPEPPKFTFPTAEEVC